MNLADILRDSNYRLSQFQREEVDWLEASIFIKQTKKGDTAYVKCLVRNKDIQLKPEEAIRQLYLKVLIDRYGYPADRMVVEYPVKFGRETKKADIAVMDKDRPTVPYIIVELKKPKEKDGKDQLKSYCNATGAPIGVWTNGDSISRWHRKDPNYFERITDIPRVTQTLEDILQIKFTLEDLIANDRLVQEKKSLRSLIEEMEDEVLANAGVDVFEEVFKLIFTKLYDEWLSGQGNNRNTRILEFRNTGQTETALKSKIQGLFDDAKEKWEGVFAEESKITLTPSHLAVCVRSLENVKLFNSNLDVIDEAFEYLVNQSSKGEKGQYFTPRYVIDMCVKMLNPKEDEYMIDTAAGSSGFPVHTIFHVWKQILEDEGQPVSHLFTMEEKPHRCYDYVRKQVFAIDFDEKSVRVARTLNLIAGDGQTNVLHLNSLDFDLWDEATKEEYWNDTYNEGFKRLKKLRGDKKSYKEFQFDVLMANPPFAGDIKESRIIARYDLAKKPNGKWQTKVGRDILFIERNLDFLKPGGRMAIVLPQGRFNNSSDKHIRDYIAERCRILAVVGLHGNTFKPHTGTKTSVLFVQKWNDDPKAGALCRRKEDYNIFFATMRKSGKDNSGEKIYRTLPPPEDSPDGETVVPLSAVSSTPTERMAAEMSPRYKGSATQTRDSVMGAATAENGSNGNRSNGNRVKPEPMLDNNHHLIVDHDLFNHDGMTEDGIAEAFIEFAKKEKLSFFEPSPSVTPFDAERYKQLMDGLEVTEILLSEALSDNYSIRLDSEYFRKIFLVEDHWRDKYKNLKLGSIAFITDGQHGYHEVDESSPISHITAKNLKGWFADNIDADRLARWVDEKNQRSSLQVHDVLLSTRGSLGYCAIVQENILPANIDQDLARIFLEKKDTISPQYLITYLNSNIGQDWIARNASGMVQQGLPLARVRQFPIPVLSQRLQSLVNSLIDYSWNLRQNSQRSYKDAEDLLLSELGLKDWEPTDENIAVKSFAASFGKSDRLDAEYYQPNQQKIMSVMGQSGLCIKDVAKLAKRKFIPRKEGTFHYIEIGNLSGEGFANSDVVAMDEAPSRAQWIVKTNDVITSTVRPIRKLSALIEPRAISF